MNTLPETLGCNVELILSVTPLNQTLNFCVSHGLGLRVDGSGI